MTASEAKRILHPETTLEAYAETDYYGGFGGAKKWKEAVDEACLVACEALEKQIPKKVKISIKGTTGWNTKCHCPNCRSFISKGKYCSECGQALDWSDTE